MYHAAILTHKTKGNKFADVVTDNELNPKHDIQKNYTINVVSSHSSFDEACKATYKIRKPY